MAGNRHKPELPVFGSAKLFNFLLFLHFAPFFAGNRDRSWQFLGEQTFLPFAPVFLLRPESSASLTSVLTLSHTFYPFSPELTLMLGIKTTQ